VSVLADDLYFYGTANMPEDDSGGAGGAADTAVGVVFTDISPAGRVQAVSTAADTTQTVTMTYRDSSGIKKTEAITLTGTTPALSVDTDVERLLKAVKSGTTTGTVVLEAVTATKTGTAQGGAAKTASQMAYITLDAGASAADDAYNGQTLRLTGGTGANQIKEIIDYRGSDKRAWVRGDWGTPPDATSAFRVCQGMVFPKTPTEVLEIKRVFFDVSADAAGGSARDFYTKIAVKNNHATLALISGQIAEGADPTGKIDFALPATLGDSGTSSNRITPPAALTFNSATKAIANSGNLTPGAYQGMWLHLALAAGDAAIDSTYTPRVTGSSV